MPNGSPKLVARLSGSSLRSAVTAGVAAIGSARCHNGSNNNKSSTEVIQRYRLLSTPVDGSGLTPGNDVTIFSPLFFRRCCNQPGGTNASTSWTRTASTKCSEEAALPGSSSPAPSEITILRVPGGTSIVARNLCQPVWFAGTVV